MDFGEKVLYQQIHPAKLAADVSGSIVSTYLMRRRRFAWAMLAAFVPAVAASVLVIAYADLERRKHSQAHTHRVGHSRCGLGLRALA
jgi:hypothetical protein